MRSHCARIATCQLIACPYAHITLHRRSSMPKDKCRTASPLKTTTYSLPCQLTAFHTTLHRRSSTIKSKYRTPFKDHHVLPFLSAYSIPYNTAPKTTTCLVVKDRHVLPFLSSLMIVPRAQHTLAVCVCSVLFSTFSCRTRHITSFFTNLDAYSTTTNDMQCERHGSHGSAWIMYSYTRIKGLTTRLPTNKAREKSHKIAVRRDGLKGTGLYSCPLARLAFFGKQIPLIIVIRYKTFKTSVPTRFF